MHSIFFKKTIFLISFTVSVFCFGQKSVNNYKYVTVPSSFEFLKSENQYQLNALTKFLFNKYGFTALMENEKAPSDLYSNPCLGLKSNVLKESGLFKTKLVIQLTNCRGEIVYISEVGETREKEYSKAYNFALRNAFKSIEALDYKYNGLAKEINYSNTLKIKESKAQQAQQVKQPVVASKPNPSTTRVKVEPQASVENKTTTPSNTLYAQQIPNGFQIVDSTPKVVMKLISTPKSTVFIVQGKDAIVYKQDGFWYLSSFNGKKTTTQKVSIKF